MTETKLPKVLVIEDDEFITRALERSLEGICSLHIAHTVEEAREHLENLHRFEVISMDSSLHSSRPNTFGLLRQIVDAEYHGHLIAASSSSDRNNQLMQAGCSEAVTSKRDLGDRIREIVAPQDNK